MSQADAGRSSGGGSTIVVVAGVEIALSVRRNGSQFPGVGALMGGSGSRLDVIADFEDPTRVRDYKLGNAQLVELEPLSPLTEEKRRYHRELRRKEHGWKKPEHVLVEGEPIPEGIDPMTVRFIPKKHPFALSSDDAEEPWSEDTARRRLRQRRGRPEKELERSRQQLDRVRTEMKQRDAALVSSKNPAFRILFIGFCSSDFVYRVLFVRLSCRALSSRLCSLDSSLQSVFSAPCSSDPVLETMDLRASS